MIVVLISLLSLALAEPPIGDGYERAHRQYLPPDFSEGARTKSTFNEALNEIPQEYGSPSFRGAISQQYGTPNARSPSFLYGAPNTRNIQQEYSAPTGFSDDIRSGLTQVYGEPTTRNSPSEIYGAPQRSSSYSNPQVRATSRHSSPVQKYGVPRFNNQSPVQHGSLTRSYQSPMDTFKSLKNQFNTRSNVQQTYGAPTRSTEYGAPGITAADSYSQGLSRSLSSAYGAPNSRTPSEEYGIPEARTVEKTNPVATSYPGRSSQEDYDVASHSDASSGVGYSYSRSALEELLNQEPANYEFGYKVSDYTSGSDFGHAETRQAERAEGSYFVVLPDGTKQVVEYEADERGFKPRISVEAAESGPY